MADPIVSSASVAAYAAQEESWADAIKNFGLQLVAGGGAGRPSVQGGGCDALIVLRGCDRLVCFDCVLILVVSGRV